MVAAAAALLSPGHVQDQPANVPMLPAHVENCITEFEGPFSAYNIQDDTITWLGDTGAGRAVSCNCHVPDEAVGEASNPVSFSTDGGRKSGDLHSKRCVYW